MQKRFRRVDGVFRREVSFSYFVNFAYWTYKEKERR